MSNGKQTKGENEARDFRRFIEESFPVKEVGETSASEKNVRQGHISTLHIWWARRPLAASRATAYAALTPAPKDAEEWQKKRDFIVQLSDWENSNNQSLLERARREILEANGGVPPKVLDPFSGGGSYPLEALRLGCESYAHDYNPVAVLIEKATMEYPQKFGRPFEGMPDWAKPQKAETKDLGGKRKSKKKSGEQIALFDSTTGLDSTDFNPLLNAVRYWGNWVIEEAHKELSDFYSTQVEGETPIGYIWAHTIECQNPVCRAKIPLMRQFLLSKKNKRNIALYPKISKGKIEFKIVGDKYEHWPDGFDPSNGTITQAIAVCPICKNTMDSDFVHSAFINNKTSQQMIAVVLQNEGLKEKKYRIANEQDMANFEKARQYLGELCITLEKEWGIPPIPDETIYTPDEQEYKEGGLLWSFSPIMLYGLSRWAYLFNDRQKLSALVYIKKLRQAHALQNQNANMKEFSEAVSTYLALALSRATSYNAILCWWEPTGERSFNVFGRQAMGMIFDYSEQNPFGPLTGNWSAQLDNAIEAIIQFSNIPQVKALQDKKIVRQGTALSLSFEDNTFDAILTDPPYYDNVPYSVLSDFFYVWLKRAVGNLHPDIFSTTLAPKSQEVIAELPLLRGLNKIQAAVKLPRIKSSEVFEDMLAKSFKEIFRVLKNNGVAVIVYAHKSTSGWETAINAILDSNLVVTSAWPINTEMKTRLRASESAALASSIYIVARKMPRLPTGFYNDVRNELRQHLDAKLHRLWEEGIGGADFFIAAIGSAIEIFGKYEQVMDYEGNIVRADRLLEEVRSIATNYAVKQILHNGFAAEITPMARFYVLWRWNYGEALVPFDEVNKLAHSCGLDLSLQFSKNGFIKKEKEFVRMLGPQGRKLDDLDDPRDMIDVMHKALLLWEKGQRNEMVKALADRGFGKSEAFYRVAQAISETLPLESKEKKLLDGFLAGRDRVQEEVEKAESQGRLL
ncbi:MAG: DUF1156 domain-containing protein [Anaerolineae bacterium]|nr:DUF1156 domain-containing protein [Anaerolineae bacterium]